MQSVKPTPLSLWCDQGFHSATVGMFGHQQKQKGRFAVCSEDPQKISKKRLLPKTVAAVGASV